MPTDTRIIDSRELIEEYDALAASLDADGTLDEDEMERMEAIRALADEGIPDWEYGVALIHEDYFTEYARELAEDIGAVSSAAGWPGSYIDWEAPADALKMDYMCVTFEGSDYWARA